MNKINQIDIIWSICRELCPCRTEIVKIQGMRQGVSCADRYLRFLHGMGLLTSHKCEGDRTDTWELTEKGRNTPKLPEKPHAVHVAPEPAETPSRTKITRTPYPLKLEQLILL